MGKRKSRMTKQRKKSTQPTAHQLAVVEQSKKNIKCTNYDKNLHFGDFCIKNVNEDKHFICSEPNSEYNQVCYENKTTLAKLKQNGIDPYNITH